AERARPSAVGWWGVKEPFAFDVEHLDYGAGARRFEYGTPAVAAILRGARRARAPRGDRDRQSARAAQAPFAAAGRRRPGSGLDDPLPACRDRTHADRHLGAPRSRVRGNRASHRRSHLRQPSRSDTSIAALLQYPRGDGPRARAARTAPRRARPGLIRPLRPVRILAWAVLIALLAVPTYALRLSGTVVSLKPDDFFKYSTAIAA